MSSSPQSFELELVRRLGAAGPRDSARFPVAIGDDMAVCPTPSGIVLLSSDMMLDGVHFKTSEHTPEQMGRKAVAACLSDCAAMFAAPTAVLLSVAFPRSVSVEWAERLVGAAREAARAFGAELVGGDTTRWDAPLAIDVSLLATPLSTIAPVLRSGAQSGDRLYVTGSLGASIDGKHLSFSPRIREAEALAAACGDAIHAAIDITDGLAIDLWRLATASGVGVRLDEDALRACASDALRRREQDPNARLRGVLSDGEDYELLIAIGGEVPAGMVVQIGGVELRPIGEAVPADAGLTIDSPGGQARPLPIEGYAHE